MGQPRVGRSRQRNEFTVVIDRPVDEVFAFVTDLPRTPQWRTTVRQSEALQWHGVSPVGTRFRAVTRVAGRRWNWSCQVTAWDPPERFAYVVVEGRVPMEVGYRCAAHGEACRFTLWAEADQLGGFLGRIAVPMIAWGMRREVRAQLGNLKRILEA